MVSRSLEKMLMIAIGLTTAVLVGVPILMYAIDILNTSSQYGAASVFANRVHQKVLEVDSGNTDVILDQITIPSGVTIAADGVQLTIQFSSVSSEQSEWSREYNHTIALVPPLEVGLHLLEISINGGSIQIIFTKL